MELQNPEIKMYILYVQYFVGMHEKRLKSGKTNASQYLSQDSSDKSTCNNEQQKRKKTLCNMHNESHPNRKIRMYCRSRYLRRFYPSGTPLPDLPCDIDK